MSLAAKPLQTWRAAMAAERMHHGWILAGRRGLGKGAFAMSAAREWVAERGLTQPAGEHVDIHLFTNQPATPADEKKRAEGEPFQAKRNITIEQVRRIQRELTTRPTLGARRAIIIDSADDLEPGAANALLKSLEEPPAGTVFLLVAHRPGRLLATIRSRCRMIHFAPLPEEEVEAFLREEAPQADAEARAAAIAGCGGSPGAALQFLALDLARPALLMRRIAQEGDRDLSLRTQLAATLGARPERERQLAMIGLARAITASRADEVVPMDIPALTKAHAEIARLEGEAATYNYDPGLLALQLGTLLARLAAPREAADG